MSEGRGAEDTRSIKAWEEVIEYGGFADEPPRRPPPPPPSADERRAAPEADAARQREVGDADQVAGVAASLLGEVLEELRFEIERSQSVLQGDLSRLREQVAEDRRQHQSQLADMVQSLHAAMAGLRELAARPAAIPKPLLGLPAAVTALREELVAGKGVQNEREGEALDAIEARVDRRLADYRKEVQETTTAALKRLVGGLREALAEQQHRVTEVAEGLRTDVAILRRLVEGAGDGWVPVEAGSAVAPPVDHLVDAVGTLRRELAAVRELLERPPEPPDQAHVLEVIGQLRNELAAVRETAERSADDRRQAEERHHQHAEMTGALNALYEELASLRRRVDRGVDIPEPLVDLPASLAAMVQQLGEEQRRQERRQEQALRAIEARIDERLAAQRRELQQRAGAVIETVSAPARDPHDERRQRAPAFVEVGESIRSELAALRRAVEDADLPEQVLGLPAAVAALGQKLGAEQRRQQNEVAELASTLRSELAALRVVIDRPVRLPDQVVAIPGTVSAAMKALQTEIAAVRDRLDRPAEVPEQIRKLPSALVALTERFANEVAAVRDRLERPGEVPEQLRKLPATLSSSMKAVQTEIATLRDAVARASDVPDGVRKLPQELVAFGDRMEHELDLLRAAVERAGEVPEPVRRIPGVMAELGEEVREEQRRQTNAISDLSRTVDAELAALRDAVERAAKVPDRVEALPGALAALAENVQTEIAALGEAVEHRAVPESLRGLPGAVAALDERLGRELAALQAAAERPLPWPDGIEELPGALAALRAAVERPPDLPDDLRRLPDAVAALEQRLAAVREVVDRPAEVPELLRGLPAALAALGQSLRAEMAAMREATAVPDEVAALPATLAAERQEAQQRHDALVERVLAQIGTQLEQERQASQAHITAIAAAANAWFVRARDLILERLDRVERATALPAADDLARQLAALRGELAAIDEGLGGLWRDVQVLVARVPVDEPAPPARAPTGKRAAPAKRAATKRGRTGKDA